MADNLEPLIKKKKAEAHLDHSLLQCQTSAEMFKTIHEHHELLRKGGVEAAPDRTQFILESKFSWPCYFRKRNSSSCKKCETSTETETSRD